MKGNYTDFIWFAIFQKKKNVINIRYEINLTNYKVLLTIQIEFKDSLKQLWLKNFKF